MYIVNEPVEGIQKEGTKRGHAVSSREGHRRSHTKCVIWSQANIYIMAKEPHIAGERCGGRRDIGMWLRRPHDKA